MHFPIFKQRSGAPRMVEFSLMALHRYPSWTIGSGDSEVRRFASSSCCFQLVSADCFSGSFFRKPKVWGHDELQLLQVFWTVELSSQYVRRHSSCRSRKAKSLSQQIVFRSGIVNRRNEPDKKNPPDNEKFSFQFIKYGGGKQKR